MNQQHLTNQNAGTPLLMIEGKFPFLQLGLISEVLGQNKSHYMENYFKSTIHH